MVNRYANYIAEARVYNRQGYPVGAEYLSVASDSLRTEAQPILDNLVTSNTERAEDSMAGQHPFWLLLIGLSAVAALIWLSVMLAQRFRRYVNAGIAIAIVYICLILAPIGLVGLLVPPLLLVSGNALRVRNCDWSFGFACYGAMTVLSALWAAGVGVSCGLVAGPRRTLSNALPYLFLVGCVLHSVWRFYDAPGVFSYNPLAGYFSGNLYDEEIRLGEPLLWSRVHQTLAVAAVGAALAVLTGGRLSGPATRRPPCGPVRGAPPLGSRSPYT